jgi:protein involved in polysaccharide export with SLBB domain
MARNEGAMRVLLLLVPLALAACTKTDPLTALAATCTPSGGPVVSVGGEVARPGRYPLQPDTTVRGALYEAGGLTSLARPAAVEVERCGRRITVDLDAIAAGRANDPRLVPGDRIEVARSLN